MHDRNGAGRSRKGMPRRLRAWAPVAALLLAPAASGAADAGWKPELMDRAVEIAEATAAGPPSFAVQAGVYVLTGHGYELARKSANGFHCLVGRDWPGAFEPQCFDAEGSRTLLQETLLEARLRMQGATREQIRRAVADAYARGELRAPSRSGINYMLSPKNRVPADDAGTIVPYRPHVMIYAPYLTNRDFGAEPPGPDHAGPVFVIDEGAPGAYLIVPVP